MMTSVSTLVLTNISSVLEMMGVSKFHEDGLECLPEMRVGKTMSSTVALLGPVCAQLVSLELSPRDIYP